MCFNDTFPFFLWFIVCLVGICDLSNDFTRNTCCNNVGWYIFCDDTSRANDCIITNGNALIDLNSSANPDVVSNLYRFGIACTMSALSRINRMIRCIYTNSGS